jgi:hypothetical protein
MLVAEGYYGIVTKVLLHEKYSKKTITIKAFTILKKKKKKKKKIIIYDKKK